MSNSKVLNAVAVRVSRPEVTKVTIGSISGGGSSGGGNAGGGGGGISMIKQATDMDMGTLGSGANGYPILYNFSTNSFYLGPFEIDDGFF
jgi:hypothetical protein